MQVHFDNFSLKRKLAFIELYCIVFMETISIVKLIKIVKNKQDNGCVSENFHIHMIYKYI